MLRLLLVTAVLLLGGCAVVVPTTGVGFHEVALGLEPGQAEVAGNVQGDLALTYGSGGGALRASYQPWRYLRVGAGLHGAYVEMADHAGRENNLISGVRGYLALVNYELGRYGFGLVSGLGLLGTDGDVWYRTLDVGLFGRWKSGTGTTMAYGGFLLYKGDSLAWGADPPQPSPADWRFPTTSTHVGIQNGVAWQVSTRWRLFGEVGYGLSFGNRNGDVGVRTALGVACAL